MFVGVEWHMFVGVEWHMFVSLLKGEYVCVCVWSGGI